MMKILSEERGSVIVMVAAAMIIFVAAAGLVVDVGFFYLHKAKMQNGVDAAALAGAAALPSTAGAESAADQYTQLNGLDPGNLDAIFSESNRRIDVRYTRLFETFFMKILGIDTVNVSVVAAAQLAGPGRAFDFTIFSGSLLDILPINGSRLYVDGSVHSNEDLRVNGSGITITGVAEAVGKFFVNGTNISIGAQESGVDVVPMPDYSAEIAEQAANANQVFNCNKTYNGSLINVNGNIHVNGSVSLNGNRISGSGAILASGTSGDIYINGNIISANAGDQVALYSENGDIHINGNNITIDGILYAPNGSIHINGTGITINGRIVGQTVALNGTNLTVNGASTAVTSLPSAGVQLVK